MNAVPFDTLKLARGLEAAGMAAPMAAGTVAALAEAMGSAELATKADVGACETRVMAAIAALRAETTAGFKATDARFDTIETSFNAKLELLRRDMTIKLGGMLMVATGVILAAMRFMPHP